MRQRFEGDEVDFAAFHVLKTLCHRGPMRLSSLASALELDASTVSRHARQLEDRGLLERTGDPDDGRASRVTVSEHGEACLEKGASLRRALIAGALESWTDAEREQLRVLLNRFQDDLLSQHTDAHAHGTHPDGAHERTTHPHTAHHHDEENS
jgi:DNA-binding MarR family transcriptional regulator